jgi:dihydrofolate synthase/folylpolyglutamate synthase
VSKEFIIDFVEKIKAFSEEINPSFFELTFVMALEYFVQQKVAIAVIETGLGGRLDSTNVIIPLISVITNIGYDHMDILGNTLQKIAAEKAGIIKQGIPVVVGETTPETREVFKEKAKEKKTVVYFAEKKFTITAAKIINDELEVEVLNNEKNTSDTYHLDLPGVYQSKNLLTALTAIEILQKRFVLPGEIIKEALRHVKTISGLQGRWEIIRKNPLIVLDVAHNVDGIHQILLQIYQTPFKKLHIIFGMVKDKDIENVLALLPKNASYYFTKAQIPRALPEKDLMTRAQTHGLAGESFTEVNSALQAAINHAEKNDMIIVCGSVFVVGEVEISTLQVT